MEVAGKRFVGRVTNKVDAKGRVSVPADLRRFLDGPEPATEPPSFMRAAVAFFGQALWCGGPDLPEILYDIVRSDDLFADIESDRELQDAIFEEIELLKFDENGRVTLPPSMREEAALGPAVTFAGRGSYFVIGNAERMAEGRQLRRTIMSDNADIVKTRSGPARVSRKGGPTS